MSSIDPVGEIKKLSGGKGLKSPWMIAAIVGGGLIVYLIWNGKSSGTPTTTTTTDGLIGDQVGLTPGTSDFGGNSGSGDTGGDTIIIQPGPAPVTAPPRVNVSNTTDVGGEISVYGKNTSWIRAGVAYLTARGIGGTLAQRSLTKYLGGQKLTYREGVIVNSAIKGVGLQPQKVKAAQVTPKPKPKPKKTVTKTPAKAKAKKVTKKKKPAPKKKAK